MLVDPSIYIVSTESYAQNMPTQYLYTCKLNVKIFTIYEYVYTSTKAIAKNCRRLQFIRRKFKIALLSYGVCQVTGGVISMHNIQQCESEYQPWLMGMRIYHISLPAWCGALQSLLCDGDVVNVALQSVVDSCLSTIMMKCYFKRFSWKWLRGRLDQSTCIYLCDAPYGLVRCVWTYGSLYYRLRYVIMD